MVAMEEPAAPMYSKTRECLALGTSVGWSKEHFFRHLNKWNIKGKYHTVMSENVHAICSFVLVFFLVSHPILIKTCFQANVFCPAKDKNGDGLECHSLFCSLM